jgi:hypothetical protein
VIPFNQSRFISNHLLFGMFVTLMSIIFLLSTWVGSALAEAKSGVYVFPIGNVGGGVTQFYSCSDPSCAYSYTNSSTQVYYLRDSFRHFHCQHCGPEWEIIRENYNAYSTPTIYRGWATWGTETSQHHIKGVSGTPGSTFYTSTTGYQSSASWWTCGASSCP